MFWGEVQIEPAVLDGHAVVRSVGCSWAPRVVMGCVDPWPEVGDADGAHLGFGHGIAEYGDGVRVPRACPAACDNG